MDWCSQTGYIIYIRDTMIVWKSSKQPKVARSSMEAEFQGITNTLAEIEWLSSAIRELGIPVETLATIWCDNRGATHFASNLVYHTNEAHRLGL